MANGSIQHFGVLGMKWGRRKSPEQLAKAAGKKAIEDAANRVLNNRKSTEKEVSDALASIGIDPKTGKVMKTKPVYDKHGNDVSVNPYRRLFKEKGMTDKQFDELVDAEMNPPKPKKMVGKPVKTLFGTRTEAVYDKSGNDISSKPFGRPFKRKGQSDKDYDAEFEEGNSDDKRSVAKRRVAEIAYDKQAKAQLWGSVISVVAISAVGLYAKHKLNQSVAASMQSKFGPEVWDLIKNIK